MRKSDAQTAVFMCKLCFKPICLISKPVSFLLYPSASAVTSPALFLAGVMQIVVKMFFREWWRGDQVPRYNCSVVIFFLLGNEVRVSSHLRECNSSFSSGSRWRSCFYMFRNNRREKSEKKKRKGVIWLCYFLYNIPFDNESNTENIVGSEYHNKSNT